MLLRGWWLIKTHISQFRVGMTVHSGETMVYRDKNGGVENETGKTSIDDGLLTSTHDLGTEENTLPGR